MFPLFALTLCILSLMLFVFRWISLRQMSESRVRNYRGPHHVRSVFLYLFCTSPPVRSPLPQTDFFSLLRHGGPPPKALHQSGLTMGKMSGHGEPKFSEGQLRVFTNLVRLTSFLALLSRIAELEFCGRSTLRDE